MKIGRNDPCHCGSGKKYKNCHMPMERHYQELKTVEAKFVEIGEKMAPSTLMFGEEGEKFISIIELLCNSLDDYEYIFTSNEEHEEVLKKNFRLGMKIYWTEILERAHLAAATSILRNFRWVSGAINAIEQPNYHLFCAAFRGFMEAAADTDDALRNVPSFLSESFLNIKLAVNNRARGSFMVAPDLENKLIHFSHARKLSKKSQFPNIHRAKTSRAYLDRLGEDEIHHCYSELCEITHPASTSVVKFLDFNKDGNFVLRRDIDYKNILLFCSRHHEIMLPILYLAFNSAILTLKVLNTFDLKRIQTPAVNLVSSRKIPLWQKIRSNLNQHGVELYE